MPIIETSPMHDHTIVVRRGEAAPITEETEEVIEEHDLDFLTNADIIEGENDETERPKSNRRKRS